MSLVRIWLRSFTIVTCTALNVSQISAHNYLGAFFTGGILSWIWWGNTRTASSSEVRFGQAVYAFGAGCGTLTGMWIGRMINDR